jgi:hypothetical protein
MLVDFEKALDAVDRNKLWNIIETCEIQGKLLNLIQEFYKYYAQCSAFWEEIQSNIFKYGG